MNSNLKADLADEKTKQFQFQLAFSGMEGTSDKSAYVRVAASIRRNGENINKALANTVIESKIQSHEDQIVNLVSLDTSALFINDPSSGYYDLNRVANIFAMLELEPKAEAKKKPKFIRSDSVASSLSSTTSSPTRSLDDVTQDDLADVKFLLNGILETLEKIASSNTLSPIQIQTTELNSIKTAESVKNEKLVDMSSKLHKLAKELQNIVSSDSTSKDQPSLNIDEKLVKDLSNLVQVRHETMRLFDRF